MINYGTHHDDRRSVVSALWIFLVFNVIYGSDQGFVFVKELAVFVDLSFSGTHNPNLQFLAAFVLELQITMIVLTRLLPDKLNTWINLVVAGLTICVTVASASLNIHDVTQTVLQLGATSAIIWFAALEQKINTLISILAPPTRV